MRAYELQNAVGIENLKLVTRDIPKAGPGEVIVRLKAASLNYRDLATVAYMGGRFPFVPLSDGAGDIVDVGAGVTRVKTGDRVAPSFFPHWLAGAPTAAMLAALGSPYDGCAADYLKVSAEGVTIAPKNFSYEEIATLPCAALTAWRGLMVEGGLKAGDTVLVQGTGGVSIFALQFAKAAGARVIVTSSSDEKLERARALGADALINYKTIPDWASEARKLTDGHGVDHVIEVGGADTFMQSIMAIRLGGHIAVIGLLSGMTKDMNVAAIFSQNAKISGVTVGSRAMVEDMVRAIEQNDIRPVIDKRFALEEFPDALRLMQGASHFGKIVLNIG
ncbi:MAG: NAD(P)-dependent alcohol dehydrogenase [Pseudomonadota bacterium]